jgi:PBP1b-binding outer membrane lipoprotein LpoB
MTKEGVMKTLAILTATALLLAGCAQYGGGFYGKGKAPPPAAPVVTKG